ncbi:MAG: DUF1211 domain-containing protein [Planctomycetes bacterium]|nr:DUF1211 domain-containing protein [Planctomycetota bacterium]
MLREHLFQRTAPTDRWFRWRGGAVSRVEALSDGVFALALAFLVTSIPIPHSYAELLLGLRHLPALGLCFAMLMLLWYSHHLFFRRFGLEDAPTVALNAAFLFLVLAYVYPLRFLASFLLWRFSGGALSPPVDGPYLAAGEGFWLMPFYSAGVIAVFGMLWCLHRHAWSRRRELELDAIEEHLTRAALRAHAISASIGVASLAIALLWPQQNAMAGWIYACMGPAHAWHGRRSAQVLERLQAQLVSQAEPELRK